MPSSDVIVIGGGTNGLACAFRLAGSGRKVTVLEAAGELGGGAAGWDFAPGYRAPGLAHLVNLLDPRVAKGMDLAGRGLSLLPIATTAVSAEGEHLVMEGAYGARLAGEVTAQDRLAWEALRAQLLAFAGVLEPFKALAPPRLAKAGNDWGKLARLGLGLRGLGKEQFREFLRMLLINIWDVAEDEISDARLKAVLGFDATLGAWMGPRSPNSLILLLNRLAGEVNGQTAALAWPRGGMGAVAAAMAQAVTAAGVTVLRDARVASLVFEAEQVAGVRLAGGEVLHAGLVVSAISPKTTLLQLAGPRHLDTGLINAVRHQKSRGAAAKLHLGLTGAPDFRGADLRSRLVLAPSLNAVELAFNPVKYGAVPDKPVMEVVLPSAFEAGHAPEGRHVLSAVVQFAPHDPKDRAAAKAAMLENTLAVLETHAPGLRDRIAHVEFLMPWEIESRFGMVGGNWHHGELSVEQMLFLRPVPGLAQYQTPLPGLWLASAGSHPGGGISGAAGWNAAERIIREVRA